MNFEHFWYVVAETKELTRRAVLGRKVLGEHLAIFRGADGKPAALEDRCLHRSSPLSKGTVVGDGCLRCPYHGWTYDGSGRLVAIPSEGERSSKLGTRATKAYAVREQDDFVYVRLTGERTVALEPFAMPHYKEPGWHTIRLQNRFRNSVTNCAENFVDVPHTAFVHEGIFRKSRRQQLRATITRKAGSVQVTYHGETSNLGTFSRFLNPGGGVIEHVDNFHMPNVTSVEYGFGPRRRFFITSQSVPVTDSETLVYTDLTYDYGAWTRIAAPFVRWHGQRIINQDIVILGLQQEVLDRHGRAFSNSPADVIHVFIESIRDELANGGDPRLLPERHQEIEFWV